MEVYFVLQKELLDELFIRDSEFKDFITFLKKNFRGYTLLTNYKDFDELIEHSSNNPLLEILMDKFDKITYNIDLESIIRCKEVSKYTSKRTLLLSNIDDVLCHDYLTNHGILSFNLNTLTKWNNYNEFSVGKKLKVTNDDTFPIGMKFSTFSDFTKYLINCDSIIIFDKFLFGEKANQKTTKNLHPLLESLLSINKNNVDIMIVSEFKDDEIKSKHSEIIKFLNSKSINNFNLKLVHFSKAFQPSNSDELHSRFILSNYFHIRSNGSFNYFKDNGKYNQLVDIDINFNLTTSNRFYYEKDLDCLKKYVLKTKNEPACANKNLQTVYHPSKHHSLLN